MQRIAIVIVITIICSCGLLSNYAVAEDATSSNEETKEQIDPEAREVLRDAARFFEGLKSLSFTETTTYEWQYGDKSGGSTKTMTVWARKPNKFKWRRTQEKRDAYLYYYNGDSEVNCLPRRNQRVFHVRDAPSSLDKLYEQMERGGGLYRLKWAMLTDKPYESGLSLVERVAYEGREIKNGTPCHHLKATVRDAEDKQFVADAWLAAEGKPVIEQISADLPKSKGGMQTHITARYGDWKFDPELSERAFEFVPGPNTVPFWETPQRSMLGKLAPELNLKLLDGGRLKLSDHRGSDVVVLDFWATWCGPCIRSLPDVVEVTDAVDGVQFYAVNMEEKPKKIRQFLNKQDLEAQVALDRDGSAADKYHVWSIPAPFVIGKDGSVQSLSLGLRGRDSDKEKAIERLRSLVKGEEFWIVKRVRLHRNVSQMIERSRWRWGQKCRMDGNFVNSSDGELTLRVWMEIPGEETFEPTELRIPAGKERKFKAMFTVPPADTEVLPVIKYVLQGDDWTNRSIRRIRPLAAGHYLATKGEPPEDARMRLQHERQVVCRQKGWEGQKDCSGAAWLRREEKGIRFHVNVEDDVLKASSRKPWQNDAVEIFLDIRPPGSRGNNKKKPGWFQVIAVPDIGKTIPNSLHYYAATTEKDTPQWITMDSGTSAEGYWVEVYLSYAGLEDAHGGVPEKFRFDYAVDDADGEDIPTTQMAWSGGLNTNYKPHLWGILTPYEEDQKDEQR